MRALVLGGCGFIGSHIVDALCSAAIDVRVVDRNKERYRPPVAGVDYRHFDFNDAGNMAQALEGVDVVVHALSTTLPASSNANPIFDINTNLVGTVQLLELMKDKQMQRIVFLSSGGTVYGRPLQLPIAESHPLHPLCSYAAVKVAIEHYLNVYSELYDLRPTILRAANPYGPRQDPNSGQGAIAAFAKRIILQETITVWGDGSTVRDFFHVRDLAALTVSAVKMGIPGIFNAGSGMGYSLNEIIHIIANECGKTAQVDYLAPRAFDIPEIVLDIHHARATFDWSPATDLGNGIHEYCDWLTGIPA